MGLTQQLPNQDGAGQHLGLPRDDTSIAAEQTARNGLQQGTKEDRGECLVGRQKAQWERKRQINCTKNVETDAKGQIQPATTQYGPTSALLNTPTQRAKARSFTALLDIYPEYFP